MPLTVGGGIKGFVDANGVESSALQVGSPQTEQLTVGHNVSLPHRMPLACLLHSHLRTGRRRILPRRRGQGLDWLRCCRRGARVADKRQADG